MGKGHSEFVVSKLVIHQVYDNRLYLKATEYTRMENKRSLSFLTSEQLAFYQENGYMVLENMADQASCDQLINRAAELVDELKGDWEKAIFSTKNQKETSNDYFLTSGDKVRIFMEEEENPDSKAHHVNKIGHNLHDLDPVFEAFSHRSEFAKIASDIGMERPGLIQSMYIFKQPKIGGEVNVHQDATFLYTEPVSVTGFWFAIQDATLENGCLWALPGGHKIGLKSRFVRAGSGTDFETLDATPIPTEGYVPLEVKAGTLVLLHGLLPHYSEANRSSKPRQAYAVHVIDQVADYPGDNWLWREAALRGFE